MVIESPPHNINDKLPLSETFTSSSQELLHGLSLGLSVIKKRFDRIRASPKHLKLVFVVGIEGSGHHLWTQFFQHIQSDARIYYDDVWGRTTLQKCLLLCFSVTYWDEQPTNTIRDWLDRSFRGWRSIDNYCDCFVDKLLHYAKQMKDNSLLVLNHAFSYTFNDLVINHYPDLGLLIRMAQSSKLLPHIFDVRLIVMRRDVASCLVSSCVHRFGYCTKRIQYAERGMSLIQTQLLAIDTQFWIMIDYDHLVRSYDLNEEYGRVVSQWLGLRIDLVKKAFGMIKPSKTTLEQSQWKELSEYQDPDDGKRFLETIQRVFYNESQLKWPIFNSPYFCVAQNKLFLQSKQLS